MDIISILSHGIVLPNKQSILIFSSIVTHCVLSTILIPTNSFIKGAKLKDGTQLTYKLNGTWVHLSGVIVYLLLSVVFGFYPLSIIYDHYGALLTTSILFSALLSAFLYLRTLVWIPVEKRNIHYPNNPIMNFWVGTELNPHFFGLEIKLFAYRPAFVLLTLINVSCLAVQYEKFGTISIPMIMFQLISLWYAIDCFLFENALVFMFDIIEENFGFMLVFGCYTWIPFVFSLQAMYLIDNWTISVWHRVVTLVVFLGGFYIFRQANYQKFVFRQNPKALIWGKAPKAIVTKRGTKLLVSGWWGVARKINYLGDILVAVSMSLPCGTQYLLPWLYPIYLTILLINRAYRDNERCKAKYGEDWDKYCEAVPYSIVPYIY
jgi:delta14-sterol reductase